VILDKQQLKAINNNSSTVVVAGPGSGKTRCLTEKAKLIKESIIVLTFTRSASQELRSRNINSHTIHSYCYSKLRYFPGSYNELLTKFLRKKTKEQYHTTLIDEFQDLTSLELEVVLSITKTNLFFVGDPKQAIFNYESSEGSEIAKSSLDKYTLTSNYRSNSTIVNKLERIYKRHLVSKGPNEKIQGTVILARTNRTLSLLALFLEEKYIKFKMLRSNGIHPGGLKILGRGTLTLSTIHSSKGKEWKKVICLDWPEVNMEKNLLYVASSRASKEFYYVENFEEAYEILL